MTSPDHRRIKIDVVVDSDTRGGAQAARALDDVDKSATKAGKGVKGLTDESKELNAELAKTRARIRDLGAEYARTGDSSIFGDLRKERAHLTQIKRIAKEIAEEAQDATKRGLNLAFQAPESLGPLKGVVIGALIAAAVASAPAIGAIVGGAVAGTAVGGGMAGGIIAATNDTRVRAAFKDFTADLTAEAFGGEAFVMPVVESINLLKTEFKDLNLGETFEKAASSVPVFTQGLADLVSNAMPGFNKLMEQAPEFTDAFAEGLGEVGEGFGDFLASLSESEGTIEGLRFGMTLLSKIIVGTGNALQWLGDRFEDMRQFGVVFNGIMEDVFGWVPIQGDIHRQLNDMAEGSADRATHLAQRVGTVATEMDKQRDGVDGAAEAWKHINDEWERSIDLQANLLQGQIGFEEALDELNESLQENGKNFDINTEAGRENMRALIDVAESARAIRQSMIEAGSGTDAANEAFRQNIAKLYEMGENAGIARWQIDQLIGKLLSIPVTYGEFVLSTTPRSEGRRDGRATGGFVRAGNSYPVGELGHVEIFEPSVDGYIHPSVTAWSSAMGTRGSGGEPTQIVLSFAPSGNRLLDAILGAIRAEVGKSGPGVLGLN